ncbi:MAG: phosphatidylserine/phosphatidylglycerophosphate/cardiolipin synthase-like protein [uncultured bacterium]|nr:MAG: phosphatidylserine/phosphatidylglycerophosphate/cardiolipin synthase-like protein [uncultured bacterium]
MQTLNVQKTIILIFLFVFYLFSVFGEVSFSGEIQILQQKIYPRRVLKLIRDAKKNVKICMPACDYTENKDDLPSRFLKELVMLAKRGIHVEVILEGGYGEELGKVNSKARRYLKQNGVLVFDDPEDKITGTNMLIVDDFTCIVGTFLWTLNSLTKNKELGLYIESEDLSKALTDYFEEIKIYGHKTEK